MRSTSPFVSMHLQAFLTWLAPVIDRPHGRKSLKPAASEQRGPVTIGLPAGHQGATPRALLPRGHAWRAPSPRPTGSRSGGPTAAAVAATVGLRARFDSRRRPSAKA